MMQDKEYLKYLESFTETRLDRNRNFPKISPFVKDYDFVEGVLSGYDQKWVARIGKMHLYRELISELIHNPECVYDICYERSDLDVVIPAEFSAVLKRPNYWCEVDYDIFASRLLNYLGLQTVFNRRFEAFDESVGYDRNYVASISFVKQDEVFVDLYDTNLKFDKKFDLINARKYGLEETLDRLELIVKNYLKTMHIAFLKEDIERYRRFMAKSIAVRVGLLSDGDFKNGNAGVVVNEKTKKFRPAPNFDFGELFDEETFKDEKRISLMRDFASAYPEDFLELAEKIEMFVLKKNGNRSVCEKMLDEFVREDNIRETALKMLEMNAEIIRQIQLEFLSCFQNG